MSINKEQLQKIKSANGFIAALDQSGGSTPKALLAYGIKESAYSNEEEMLSTMHKMRARIVTSPSFGGNRILGAILFENTLDREIEGLASSRYLWEKKNVVPFLKVDKGLAEERDGVQLMKPMPDLMSVLEKAKAKGVFGTKMRAVIKLANPAGIEAIVAQQFEVGLQILNAGLIPILEPEVDIKSPEKTNAEALLKDKILTRLKKLAPEQKLMFKLTLPDTVNFYSELVSHPNVLRVVALSGGYSRKEANQKLAQNKGVVASFSRALTEGLTAQQSDKEFDATLDKAIEEIFQASKT